MTRRVAFLRAVNVGTRTVAMARLRAEFEALGLDEVATYVNSGNVVFSAAGRARALETAIATRLSRAFGFEVPTFVRSANEVRRVADHRPFGAIGPAQTHMVYFLRAPPTAAMAKAITRLSGPTDRLVVDGREVHWLIDGKNMDSQITPKTFARACDDQFSTGRNTTMLVKLVAKLNG
ncbi:MAG: DUF1697 domain-containing protein [Actinomycetota bacterium]